MGLFDRKPGGFVDKANAWMTPERAAAMSAIGQGFSQMSVGRPVDLSNARNALLQRQQRAEQKRALEGSGLLDKFSPEQRAILATMEPSAAQKIIAGVMFEKPAGPTKGIEVGGRVIDPTTGRVIYEPDAKSDVSTKVINGQLVDSQTGEIIGDFRDPPPPPGAPTTKEILLEDGSEAVVEWRPDATDAENGGEWVPIDAPKGGGLATPQGKLTEKQSQLALFGNMQGETAPVLNEIEEQYNPANIADAAARATPLAGNFFQTAQGQVYQASASAWAEGALRISTGAAATEPEIKRIKETYFAMPGDTPQTIRFKSRLRDMFSRSLQAAMGRPVDGSPLLSKDEFFELMGQNEGAPDGLTDDDLQYLGVEK